LHYEYVFLQIASKRKGKGDGVANVLAANQLNAMSASIVRTPATRRLALDVFV